MTCKNHGQLVDFTFLQTKSACFHLHDQPYFVSKTFIVKKKSPTNKPIKSFE